MMTTIMSLNSSQIKNYLSTLEDPSSHPQFLGQWMNHAAKGILCSPLTAVLGVLSNCLNFPWLHLIR